MSFSIDQLNALESAIAEGVLLVQYENRQVRYRSLEEMLKVRQLMLKQLNQHSHHTTNNRIYTSFDLGFTDTHED